MLVYPTDSAYPKFAPYIYYFIYNDYFLLFRTSPSISPCYEKNEETKETNKKLNKIKQAFIKQSKTNANEKMKIVTYSLEGWFLVVMLLVFWLCNDGTSHM